MRYKSLNKHVVDMLYRTKYETKTKLRQSY